MRRQYVNFCPWPGSWSASTGFVHQPGYPMLVETCYPLVNKPALNGNVLEIRETEAPSASISIILPFWTRPDLMLDERCDYSNIARSVGVSGMLTLD